MRQVFAFAALSLCLVACAPGAAWQAPPTTAIPPGPDILTEDERKAMGPEEAKPQGAPLIDRDILFGNPDKAAPQLSSDGKHIAFLAPHKGVLNVWVAPADKPKEAKVVTSDTKRGIRVFFWAHSNEHILFMQDKGGDENWRVYSVNINDLAQRDLTPLDGVRAQVQAVSHKRPDEILVGLNDRDKKYHDLYRVDLRTAKRTLVQKNTGYGSFVTDSDYKVRFAIKPTKAGGNEILKKQGKTFKPWQSVPADDALTTRIVGFDASGKHVHFIDSRGRNTNELVVLKPKRQSLASWKDGDIADVLRHPKTKKVQAVSSVRERKRWVFLDEDIERDFKRLAEVSPGDVTLVSRTLDDARWTVAFVTDAGPVRYYLYDRKTNVASFLFVNRSALEGLKLSPMKPVVIAARDGLKLVSYLTLPHGTAASPSEPMPMVLFVHGGPWARDRWGFHPYHQWLANRGYAVLSVNFRGSTGFGKNFINAGDKQWAALMHDDLIDAVGWAVKQGIADPDKVAIMGGSYGGYATLVGLTFTPDRFACGVDIVGPSNLVTLLGSIPPYWESYRAVFAKRVGDVSTEEGRAFLKSRSPLTFADRIKRPLLIGQGANDPRVKQAESDQIVSSMKAKKIPVTYVLYPDEGHGFRRPPNNKSFQAVTEHFLARCLGGRAQPFPASFKGSSIQVPEGAEHIEGLTDVLSD